jgi:hypothetical protein
MSVSGAPCEERLEGGHGAIDAVAVDVQVRD